MSSVLAALALSACVVLAGCLDDEDGETQPADPAGISLDCPSEDRVDAVFDLGENPRGAPTPGEAVARFFSSRLFRSLDSEDVRRDSAGSSPAEQATFSYTQQGRRLAEFYVERLETGWLVISYSFCRGSI
jgi:hypothetical protein